MAFVVKRETTSRLIDIIEVENDKRNISIINIEKIILALNSTIKGSFNTKNFNSYGR